VSAQRSKPAAAPPKDWRANFCRQQAAGSRQASGFSMKSLSLQAAGCYSRGFTAHAA
jgi:hypothetical protein